jgi:hypothetical protein
MRSIYIFLQISVVLLFSGPAHNVALADQVRSGENTEFSSQGIDPAQLGNLEPEINIQQFDNRAVEEYRFNNHVYMVKITPSVGSPYYLVDPDGTGEMEYKRDSIGLDVNPPQWVLFRW